jgi:hypothetical protein
VLDFSKDFDMRVFYLDNIIRHAESAIYGLGEAGEACDVRIIETYLLDSCVAVIRAALVSLMRLDSQRYKVGRLPTKYTLLKLNPNEKTLF